VSDCFIASRPAINAIKDVIWAIVGHPAAESSSGRLQIGSGEVDIPCRIQQIDLEGPTIVEAWRANATTNAMENLALSVGSDADPLSMAFRALPVYRGTDWMVEENESTRPDPRLGRLRPSAGRNQVAPNQGALAPLPTQLSCYSRYSIPANGAENVGDNQGVADQAAPYAAHAGAAQAVRRTLAPPEKNITPGEATPPSVSSS
jgi:hypothetical protein